MTRSVTRLESFLPTSVRPFSYRILLVDDDPTVRQVGKVLLEAQGYEVQCASDGFEGLATLKKSLPDLIISDLRMPNMNGFEFLSVVRRRFPTIPVVVISGEFSGLAVPESVLADAFFPKEDFSSEELYEKLRALIRELPTRPNTGGKSRAAVWVTNDRGTIAVTCSDCLRTFPVTNVVRGLNQAECDFCSSIVSYEIIGDDSLTQTELSRSRSNSKSP